ncbi:hypothetical protein OL239_10420 [Arthrobacter sp. ATA002]|uniref:hypothetical protein n=1 Tax=Arthrobacter sp. ATA002 TaxID=2991715 RepID=UPI0022A7BFEB|nr:hypothetical protein [Arthrobacter sp. ATA002]WAP50472.1 hypothetical protein OL239_10420 [Arthrobacter sp. ATA002]
MQKKLTAAAIAGFVSVIGVTGCGGPPLVYNGQELSSVGQSLEDIDAAWKQAVANGVKATVSDDSRCYLQISENTVAGAAVCGPIHYLGDDETTWDGAQWEPVADGRDTYSLKPPGSFTPGQQLQANTELYRPDDKEPPADLALNEPDAPAAEKDTPFWLPVAQAPGVPEATAVTPGKPGILKSPAGTVSVTGTEISDRVGGAANRQQAPEDTQFLTIHFSELTGFEPSSDVSAMAVAVGDKTYPIETAEGESVVVPVEGDAETALLRLTYDGLDQDLSLADLTRMDETAAVGLYSNLESEPKESATRSGELTMNAAKADNAFSGSLTFGVKAERLAYDQERKWPAAGMSWLKVSLSTSTRGPEWKEENYRRGVYSLTKAIEAPTLQVDGKNITGELGDLKDDFLGGQEIWYQVPAASAQAMFTADVKMAGAHKPDSSTAKNPPATVEHVYQIRDVNLEFAPQAKNQ